VSISRGDLGGSLARFLRPLRLHRPGRPTVGVELAEDGYEVVTRGERGWRGVHVEAASPEVVRRAAREAGIGGRRAAGVLLTPSLDVFPLAVSEGRVDQQVVTQAASRLRYPVAEAVIDYAPVPDRCRRRGEPGRPVLVYAMTRDDVDRLLSPLEASGVEVELLRPPAAWLAPLAETRTLVVAGGARTTSIAVVEAGGVLLERMLDWGARDLVRRVASRLELDEVQVAELLARDAAARPVGVDPVVKEILHPVLDELVRECAAALDYCNAFLATGRVDRALVAGAASGLDDVAGVLRGAFPVEVVVDRPGLPARYGLAGRAVGVGGRLLEPGGRAA